MTKQDIINKIDSIRVSQSAWANQDKIFLKAINLDQLIEPISYFDCEFYLWISSNKKNLMCFDWYEDLKEIHAKTHHNYSNIFYGALRKYNPKTREQLAEDFREFERNLLEFNNKAFEIENNIQDMSDEDHTDTVLKSNAEYRKTAKEETDEDVASNKANDTPTKIPFVVSGPDLDQDLDTTDDVVDVEDDFAEENIAKEDHVEVIVEADLVEENITSDKKPEPIIEIADKNSKFDMEVIDIQEYSIKEEHTEELIEIETDVSETANEYVEDLIDNPVSLDQDVDENSIASNYEIVDEHYVDKRSVENKDDNIDDNKNDNGEDSNHSTDVIINTIDTDLITDSENYLAEFKTITKVKNSSENLTKHIDLKEKNISQLIQEKELSELEFKHLEETEKLSQQGLEQLDQNLSLKRQELELEKTDNEKLIQLNTEARDKIKQRQDLIEKNKTNLKNEIIDLEEQNFQDQITKENIQRVPAIEKQFDSLKQNKNKDLIRLEDHLSSKRNDLLKMKAQMTLLEDEIAEMEVQVTSKQKGISVLEEKEQIKNEEKLSLLNSKENMMNERSLLITEKQSELNKLSAEERIIEKDLENFNIHIEEINKVSKPDVNTDDEITHLENQQVKKREILSVAKDNKKQKQQEIDNIQNRLKEAEKALSELKIDMKNTKSDEEKEINIVG